MKASENSIETLMLATHKLIEQHADVVSEALQQGNVERLITYPPNHGFTTEEISALNSLPPIPHLNSALRKVFADSAASVMFNFLNFIDGTGDPDPSPGEWTDLKLVDNSREIGAPHSMIHDTFYETYWQWRKIRSNKAWKLDTYEG